MTFWLRVLLVLLGGVVIWFSMASISDTGAKAGLNILGIFCMYMALKLK